MMKNRLYAAVKQLYRAFPDDLRPREVPFSPYAFIDDENVARLLAVSRDELTDGDLLLYSDNVFRSMGSEADFKYFLPRLFELAAESELAKGPSGYVVDPLQYVAWTDWPADQVEAVRGYMLALWQTTLSDGREGEEGHLVYIGAAEPVSEFGRYLDLWLTSGRPALVKLAAFVQDHLAEIATETPWDPDATAESTAALYRWLRSAAPAHALRQAHDDDPAAPEARALLEAAALLTP